MYFFIKISSKDKQSLKSFLLFLSTFQNNSLILKYFPKQKFKKFVTVLKSPHVNKSAQEQFEFRVYTKNLVINSLQNLKFLYFLKKIQNNIFPFINIKVKMVYNKKTLISNVLDRSNPHQLNTKFLKKKPTKILSYLQLLECYGELKIIQKY